MTISVLSYNSLYSKAIKNLGGVLDGFNPDIVCLQEVETTEANLAVLKGHGYTMADYSNSFIKFDRVFGQATFYNRSTVRFISSSIFDIPRSYYEIILRLLRGVNEPRTVLKTEFRVKSSNLKITVYNVHLSAQQATNKARSRQLEKTLQDLHTGTKDRIIITGDFNYPYGRKNLEQIINKYGLKEATNNIYFTSVFRLLKLIPLKFKTDYILYRGLKLMKTERLSISFSDHFPLLSVFEI